MKIYLTEEGTTTISCPKCQTAVTKNLADLINVTEIKKVRISCHCSHTFTGTLERRKFLRKKADFRFWLDEDKQLLVNKQGNILRIKDRFVSIKFNVAEHYDHYGKFLLGWKPTFQQPV